MGFNDNTVSGLLFIGPPCNFNANYVVGMTLYPVFRGLDCDIRTD